MQYVEYRDQIQRKLRRKTAGLTWKQLHDELDLPYDRPHSNEGSRSCSCLESLGRNEWRLTTRCSG